MIPSSRLVDNNTILPYDSQVALIGLVDSLVKLCVKGYPPTYTTQFLICKSYTGVGRQKDQVLGSTYLPI